MKTRKYKVQCVDCKAIFNNDCETTRAHVNDVHGGKHVGIQAVATSSESIPPNKKRKLEDIDQPGDNCEEQTFTMIPDVQLNTEGSFLLNTRPDDNMVFGNLWNNVSSEISGRLETSSWSTLIENLGDLVYKLKECKDIYEKSTEVVNEQLGAIDIINAAVSVREAAGNVVEMGNHFIQQSLQLNKQTTPCFHDPAQRPRDLSDAQKQYLINLGPHQPRLDKFPLDGKNRFCSKWYDDFEHLEYSIVKDAAFCFTCSLFRKSVSTEKREDPWVSVGVRTWSKMRSRGKDKAGKLQQHFGSDFHKASLKEYYLSFSASSNS